MAEGLLRHMAGNKFEVLSAGTNPTSVNLLAIKVMKEIGIDISNQKSKSINELPAQDFNYVITLCDNAQENCPVFRGKCEKIHWDIEDPAEVQGEKNIKIELFKQVREKLKDKIADFLDNIPY
jgi:arsenate reductase